MKIMTCPLNRPRNISEFSYGGEVRPRPQPGTDPAIVADYLYLKENRAGVTREWWCHLPTSYWFVAERDLISDRILRTYPATELATEGPAT